jgi:hypothetical protein
LQDPISKIPRANLEALSSNPITTKKKKKKKKKRGADLDFLGRLLQKSMLGVTA